jgi:dual specificity protein kinase YAK1
MFSHVFVMLLSFSCQLTLVTMQFVVRLTADIIHTYERCHPEFKYSDTLNPKRFLTHPSTPAHNNGVDNANWDLILYVNLELVNETSNRR